MLKCFFLLFVILSFTNAISLRYKEIESDIRISEGLYNELYKNGEHSLRALGSIDDTVGVMELWRTNYSNGQYIIPVTLLENDILEGTNTLNTQTSGDIFTALETMADKLDNIIKFVRYDGIDPKPDSYIKIGNFGGGCWSYVGRIPIEYQPQALNIGFGCLFTDTIEHEMMHALGFFHEHARPDRDDHVIIHWDNIDSEKYYNFNKMAEINSHGTPYDYESIMHYTSTAFALDPQFPSISSNNENANLGGSDAMTDTDQLQIRLLYRCEDGVKDMSNNCSPGCPCRINEGNCTSNTQCAGELGCLSNICVYTDSTGDPTSSPTTGVPASSPTTGVPAVSPTVAVTIGTTVTTNTPSETDNSLIIGLSVTVFIFGTILIINVI